MLSSKTNSTCSYNPLVPIALIALVVFVSTAFQTTQVFRERNTLRGLLSQQDKPLENTQKMRAQLNALAQGTLKLAQQGDKNAQVIVENLKKAGITIAAPPADKPPAEHIAVPSKQ